MYDYLTVTYDAADRRSFCRHGGLWLDWARRYPGLFDQSDVDRAANQAPNGFHYHEWLAAIRLHEATGYHCLLAKYQFQKKHPEKFSIFSKLVPEPVRVLLRPNGRPQGPDLFMYAPSLDDWFFAEAKRGGERLTPSQTALFPLLEAAWGQEIRVVRFKKQIIKSNESSAGPHNNALEQTAGSHSLAAAAHRDRSADWSIS